MIVVLGRPSLIPAAPGDTHASRGRPGGLTAAIALAARASGADVQLVGAIGDDADGDILAIELGREGVGHAALLRDPAGRTPIIGMERDRPPRLDANDVELGLGYLADYGVLVLAEPLDADALAAALRAASYQGAAIVAVLPDGSPEATGLPEGATVLQAPRDVGSAFGELVGRYAAGLDRAETPADAFAAARSAVGWDAPGS
jgi:sugar/nucleoside kinase (ribokinase family)